MSVGESLYGDVQASMVSGRNDRSQRHVGPRDCSPIDPPQWCPVGTTGVSRFLSAKP